MNAEEVKTSIIKSFHEKNNSHAFLLVTNNVSKCLSDVKDIIKIVNCENSGNDACSICTSIDKNNNPDVIIVEPEGKDIKVESIMNIISSFTTKPLVNKYSMYVIKDADKLNVSSSNKILKFLEEPEENIVGFFITEKLHSILPTIKSRCEIYNYRFGSTSLLDLLEISGEEFEIGYNKAMEMIEKLNTLPKYMLLLESKKLAELERDELDLLLNMIKKIYTIKYESIIKKKFIDLDYAKNILSAVPDNDIKIIVKRISLLDNIIEDFKFNLNKELVLNRLFLTWE